MRTVASPSIASLVVKAELSSAQLIGNPDLLRRPLLGLFCSERCPGRVILAMHDLARRLAEEGVGVISGFHSPVERECLRVLLRGKGLVVLCPARSLVGMRIKPEYHAAVEAGRMAILSCSSVRRMSRASAIERNRMVAAVGNNIIVGHIEPKGTIASLCQEALREGKRVYSWGASVEGSALGIQTVPADSTGIETLLVQVSADHRIGLSAL